MKTILVEKILKIFKVLLSKYILITNISIEHFNIKKIFIFFQTICANINSLKRYNSD